MDQRTRWEEDYTAEGGGSQLPKRQVRRTAALFGILALFWLLLSGRTGPEYLAVMLGAVIIVLWMNPERPFQGLAPHMEVSLGEFLQSAWNVLKFVVWLTWNMITANIEVARLILDPRRPIRPRFLLFSTTLKRDVSQFLVANTITLTPGTVTVDLDRGVYLVHAIVEDSAKIILNAELQNMVGRIFHEQPDPEPVPMWCKSYAELGR